MPSILLEETISPVGLRETLIGGQCFRWRAADPENPTFRGIICNEELTLNLTPKRISWSNAALSAETIGHYLSLGSHHSNALEELPWRSDPHLQRAIAAYPGLRILRQPVEEVLFCFLCSSVKTIPQIQQMLESVCADYGRPLGNGQFAFPGWSKIADIGEQPLRNLKLGYRAKYIFQTAQIVSQQFFEKLQNADYPHAKSMLVALPGVGEKIADCVCLFGLNHLQAFPVDTWIIQAMRDLYGLNGWGPDKVAHFGRTHFGSKAGLAQQFLFSWIRSR